MTERRSWDAVVPPGERAQGQWRPMCIKSLHDVPESIFSSQTPKTRLPHSERNTNSAYHLSGPVWAQCMSHGDQSKRRPTETHVKKQAKVEMVNDNNAKTAVALWIRGSSGKLEVPD